MKLPTAAKFPFHFDVVHLKADLEKVNQELWISHYQTNDFNGEWDAVALRSVCGHPGIIYAVPSFDSADFYQNTPILEECTYFKAVLRSFKCQINAVRLLSLGPGAEILEHTDDMGSADQMEMRIHIPIQTNPDVLFYLNNMLVEMKEGEVWYGDFSLPHRVENNSKKARVHMVLDCVVNDWLKRQIASGHTVIH